MPSRELNPGLGRAGRVKPQLETLEDRCCPTAFVQTPHLILTDNLSHVPMSVRDDGAGDLTVAFNGHTTTYHGVQTVNIQSTTADAEISYTLTNTLKRSEQLTLNLGQGNDQVRLDYSKGIASPKAGVTPQVGVTINGGGGDNNVAAVFGAINSADLSLTARLGSGWDHFSAQFRGDLTGNANVNVNVLGGSGASGVNINAAGAITANASLKIKVADGSNDDTSAVNYTGKLSGHLSVLQQAGAGWDWLESNINLAPGSTGWLTAHEAGGAGADLLLLTVHNDGSLHRLANHTLDEAITGVGPNSAVSATANVKVSH